MKTLPSVLPRCKKVGLQFPRRLARLPTGIITNWLKSQPYITASRREKKSAAVRGASHDSEMSILPLWTPSNMSSTHVHRRGRLSLQTWCFVVDSFSGLIQMSVDFHTRSPVGRGWTVTDISNWRRRPRSQLVASASRRRRGQFWLGSNELTFSGSVLRRPRYSACTPSSVRYATDRWPYYTSHSRRGGRGGRKADRRSLLRTSRAAASRWDLDVRSRPTRRRVWSPSASTDRPSIWVPLSMRRRSRDVTNNVRIRYSSAFNVLAS